MPSSHLILCCPLLLLPPIPPSIRVFSNESTLAWGGQSTGDSALASFLPKKFQGWSPSEWTGWISLVENIWGLPQWFSSKESTCNSGHSGSVPGLGRSTGGGQSNPLLYSCLENPMARGAWWATVHRVAKSQTWLKWLGMHAQSISGTKISFMREDLY